MFISKHSQLDVRVKHSDKKLISAFPLSKTTIAVVCPQPIHPSMAKPEFFRLESRLTVRKVQLNPESSNQIILHTRPMTDSRIIPDRVILKELKNSAGKSLGKFVSPAFVQGIHTPMELKVPHFEDNHPYRSTLSGLHVSVMCCTGCNGGIHDRDLVVLNNHSGGSWSSIWVRTAKTIEGPYPRWERVLFAGGVLEERNGSTEVVDKGWMVVKKGFEEPHHAPPALPITTHDLAMKRTKSLLTKSLDATWVQFTDITIESIKNVPPPSEKNWKRNLARTEVVFHDSSGGQSSAWLYMKSAQELKVGQKVRMLRGFVHAEKAGLYTLLSDKEEDITI